MHVGITVSTRLQAVPGNQTACRIPHMSYSLLSLMAYIGDYYIRVMKGDTRSVDYGSHVRNTPAQSEEEHVYLNTGKNAALLFGAVIVVEVAVGVDGPSSERELKKCRSTQLS